MRLLPELNFGGVESRVILQSKLTDASAIDLRVCAFHRAGAAASAIRDAGVPVNTMSTDPSVRNPRASRALRRLLLELQPDIVHSSIAEANFHNLLVGRLPRSWATIAEEVGVPEHGTLARAVFGWLYRGADSVVGVTQATCDYVVSRDRAPRARVRLVYNCAGPEFFPSARTSPRASPDGVLRVLLVGRLVPVKNQGTFVRAFARYLAGGGQATLTVAGDGPLADSLRAQCDDLRITGRVRFLGFQSDVRGLLADADLFALPSLQEGCSISLVEALASGVPAIGSCVPGIVEVLGPLASDWTADPRDEQAWAGLLQRFAALDPTARGRVAEQGQARVYEFFSPTSYMANLSKLYAQVVAARGSA